MTTISDLIAQHPQLVSKLERFSFPKAAQLVGALGMLPELFENTIRVEILTHLVAACCRGDAEPKYKDLAEWIGKYMIDSPGASLEDPAEDLFVGCVNSEFGSFRIFQGNFGDGAFLAERLLAFYAEKPDFPTFQETIDCVLILLRLCDALADRAGLSRYSAGGGHAAQRVHLPRWRDLEPKVKSTYFSNDDLKALGITRSLLVDFFLGDEHRANLGQEVMWASSLERRPLLEFNNGLLVIEPSTLSRTVVRFMVERMGIMGGWGETFYQKDNASIFVNDVRRRMNVEWFEFSAPTPVEGTPFMFPAFGVFDHGKPVIMLTYTPPLANAVNNFAGIDRLSAEEESKFESYVRACAAEFEKLPDFSGGLVLMCFSGYGRTGVLRMREWSPKWRVHIATLRDWLSLTADGECTAMRLWKLGEHDLARKRFGIQIMNPSGLPNLVAYWKRWGFRLVPRQTQLNAPRNLLAIGTDFVKAIRVEGTRHQDEHCVRSHDGKRWIRLVRHNARSLFAEDGDTTIYGAIAEARRRLIGCTKRGNAIWWVIAPELPDRADLRDLLYQIWDCVLKWADHLVLVAEREWPNISDKSVEVRLVLPDFQRWNHGRPGVSSTRPAELWIGTDQRDRSITITVPEGFLQHFNVPKNVAEQRIVAAMIEGASRLVGQQPTSGRIQLLTREITRNDDARYFHVVETREIEQLLGAGSRSRPLFVADEDTTLGQLGLADHAGRPIPEGVMKGRADCQKFLQEIVTKVWERIESRLRTFERASVVISCFRALDEVARDEAHWNLTTRSLFALHGDESQTKTVLRERRSQRSSANLGNRLLIETAQYTCPTTGGMPFTMADHGSLLAEVELLITFAHHRDAIAFRFLKPEVTIYPNGEVEVDEEFYIETLSKYLSHRSDRASDRASESYEEHFEPAKPFTAEESQSLDAKIAKLDEVFEPEFGFPVERLIKVMEVWREFAMKSNESIGQLTEPEMLSLLRRGCGFSPHQATAFLDRLTLPIRTAWDADLPPRCKKEDVYPWRFRRHLSLLMRPLVQVSFSPRAWIISASFFEKSAAYFGENVENADFPERFFASEKMRQYIGQRVNRRGHIFAEKVYDVFVRCGFSALLEVEMTELGALKNDGLGDIDVLAWSPGKGQIFPVECKRLLPALTVREVIQRLEDFRGDRKAKDSLGRHLRRIDWIKRNLNSLTKLTGIPSDKIQLLPALVTSDIVPMQFFQEMDFPPSQVVPFDGLEEFLSFPN